MTMKTRSPNDKCLASKFSESQYNLWHERLLQASPGTLEKSKPVTEGLQAVNIDKSTKC